MNEPYVKQYGKDKEGNTVLLNPLKEPYLSGSPNRKQRRQKELRMTNNRGNTHINIIKLPSGFMKYNIVAQHIPSKPIYAENVSVLIGESKEVIGYTKPKTIFHYKLKQ